MGKLFVASIKMLYRDRQALFWAMVFPVIFAVVFGLFDFEQTPEARFAVVSGDGPVAEAVVSGLEEVESLTVGVRSHRDGARG
jgi:hypothetical protein